MTVHNREGDRAETDTVHDTLVEQEKDTAPIVWQHSSRVHHP